MPNQSIQSPSGKEMFLVTNRTTTNIESKEIKKIFVSRERIEILISDSRLISSGSQFGHTSMAIDGTVYGRAHGGWDIDTRESYLFRQQVKMHRDTWGYSLAISKTEKENILKEIKKRAAENKPYKLDSNSCSSNIAEILEFAGIPAYDPRYGLPVVSPADLMVGLSHSKRLTKKETYPKK